MLHVLVLPTGCGFPCKSCCLDKMGTASGEKQTHYYCCIRFVKEILVSNTKECVLPHFQTLTVENMAHSGQEYFDKLEGLWKRGQTLF